MPVAPFAQTQNQGQANQLPNGTTERVLATGSHTGNAVGFMESTFPPGSGFPIHIYHNEDENLYILEGKLLFVAGEDFRIEAKPESRACARRRRAGAGRRWLIAKSGT